jgi:odorant receptor
MRTIKPCLFFPQISPVNDALLFYRTVGLSITMIIQVFLPCYYGNQVLVASQKLSASLFHSNWIKTDRKFKTQMKIFLEISKKPIKVLAFGFVSIDYTTFNSILNSAYSLYALVKKINR